MEYSPAEKAVAGFILAACCVVGFISLDILLSGRLSGGSKEEDE